MNTTLLWIARCLAVGSALILVASCANVGDRGRTGQYPASYAPVRTAPADSDGAAGPDPAGGRASSSSDDSPIRQVAETATPSGTTYVAEDYKRPSGTGRTGEVLRSGEALGPLNATGTASSSTQVAAKETLQGISAKHPQTFIEHAVPGIDARGDAMQDATPSKSTHNSAYKKSGHALASGEMTAPSGKDGARGSQTAPLTPADSSRTTGSSPGNLMAPPSAVSQMSNAAKPLAPRPLAMAAGAPTAPTSGAILRTVPLGAESPADCQRACRAEARCRSWAVLRADAAPAHRPMCQLNANDAGAKGPGVAAAGGR